MPNSVTRSRLLNSKRLAGCLALLLCVLFALPTLSEAQRRRRRRRPPRRPAVTAPVTESPSSDTDADEAPSELPAESPSATSMQANAAPSAAAQAVTPTRQPVAAASDTGAAGASLDALQEDYTTLMDELVQLRSRTSVIAGQLFSTRIRVVVVNESDDDSVLQRIRLTLDGAPIFQQEGSALGDEDREAFEGALAPGFHVFGVELEQRQRADRDYRYTLRDDYRFEIRPNTTTKLRLVIEDDSDVGEEFRDNDREAEGEFDVRSTLELEQVENPAGEGNAR